ncbi:MAG: hypothetical protein RLZZ399_644 [Verrucomicrobiota bacterium]
MNPSEETQSREQLTLLWREAEPSIQAFVFAAVRSFADAEDVVQQVALTIARRFDEYDPGRPFLGWALWLAKSRIADHYRKKGRERLVFSDSVLEQLAHVFEHQKPERSERQVALERCIEKLPQKSRHTLDLRYAEGLSIAEIAKRVQSTEGSMRVILSRLRDVLAGCIEQQLRKEAQG